MTTDPADTALKRLYHIYI